MRSQPFIRTSSRLTARATLASIVCALLLSTVALASAAGDTRSPSGPAGPRPTVAVAEIGGLSQFELQRGGPNAPGGGLTAMLTSALAETGRFLVVERSQLVDVLAEQQLTARDLVTGESRREPGQLIGAQWIVAGHVTELNQGEKGGDHSFGGQLTGGLLRVSPKKDVGSVAIDVKVIDSSSGAVLETFTARHTVKKRSLGLVASAHGLDLDSTSFTRTALGKAARGAIEQIVERLSRSLASRPWSGRVVEFDAGEVVLNAGDSAGIRVGQEFEIKRRSRPLTDPSTGEILGYRNRTVGTVRVTEVQNRMAFAELLGAAGSLEPQRGDVVTFNGR